MRFQSLWVAVCVMSFLCYGAVRPVLAGPPTETADKRLVDRVNSLQKKLQSQQVKGNSHAVLRVAKQLLKAKEKLHGPDSPKLVTTIGVVGGYYNAVGDVVGATRMKERALAIKEAQLGPDAFGLAGYIDHVASQYLIRDFDKAMRLYERSLQIYEKQYKEKNPALYALYLYLRGFICLSQRRYALAEMYLRQAHELMVERELTNESQMVSIVDAMATLFWERGQLQRGIAFQDQVLELYEKRPGDNALILASTLQRYAHLNRQAKRLDRARKLNDRAIGIYEELLSKSKAASTPSPYRALQADQLARCYIWRGDIDRAGALFEKAVEMEAETHGKNDMRVAIAMMHLGTFYVDHQQYKKAESLLLKSRRMYMKSQGPSGAILTQMPLANLYRVTGRYKKALRIIQKARETDEVKWGKRHPLVANWIDYLAGIHVMQKQFDKAIALYRESQDIREPHIRLMLAQGSEQDKRAFMAKIDYLLDVIVGVHAEHAPDNSDALNLAVTTLLRRKGRVLDAIAGSMWALRRKMSKKGQAHLDQLIAARGQLAKLVTGGTRTMSPSDYARKVGKLEGEVRRLEALVNSLSAAFRAQSQTVNLPEVRRKIPADMKLIEMVRVRTVRSASNWRKDPFGAAYYVAYVLGRDGAIQWVNLGDAQKIDAHVKSLREALSDPARVDVKAVSHRLYQQVFKPLMPFVQDTDRLLVAPDGALSLVPMGTLVDENNRFLIQRFSFTYLTSGRDLLRLSIREKPRTGAMILANPQYDKQRTVPVVAGIRRSRGMRSPSLGKVAWPPLPGTAVEARILSDQLPGATVLTGKDATESAIKNVRGPWLLHVATHGFFLPGESVDDAKSGKSAGGTENPLLRSGLVFSGANHLESGDEDGVLTGLETANLDLWGTQMVVLSACETAVGDIARGEGVQGLRRALIMAGSESQLMSLWQVDDEATLSLMQGVYKYLLRGQGRAASLQRVKRAMVRNADLNHPYYWGAFITSGRWDPIQLPNDVKAP